jgi:hypothetical protein
VDALYNNAEVVQTREIEYRLLADRLRAKSDYRPASVVIVVEADAFLDTDLETVALEDLHVVLDEFDVDRRKLEYSGSVAENPGQSTRGASTHARRLTELIPGFVCESRSGGSRS